MASAASDIALTVAEAICRRWEGLILTPYLCPAGVPTIGYGTTVYPDGRAVALTDPPITADTAVRLLRWDLQNRRLPAVMLLCPNVTDERLGALLDFAYNLGNGNLRASTLRRKVNANEWEAVPAELRKWVHAGGRRLSGLVARRETEIGYI